VFSAIPARNEARMLFVGTLHSALTKLLQLSNDEYFVICCDCILSNNRRDARRASNVGKIKPRKNLRDDVDFRQARSTP
jgi:hypothetical protein